jgi:S-DNA-T family DNA segregation ATPase FtsK/SpoIIIE
VAPGRSRLGDRWRGRRNAWDERWAAELAREDAAELAEAWRVACTSITPLRHRIDTPSGPTIVTPALAVVSNPAPPAPVRVRITLRPGMVPGDVADASARLALALGGRALRIVATAGQEVTADVLRGDDPLSAAVGLDVARAVAQDPHSLILGRGEDGAAVRWPLAELPHVAVQGATGSGKSVGLYGLLAQLHRREAVQVGGVDPTGLLFRSMGPSLWRCSGLRDADAVLEVLGRYVAELDARVEAMPLGRDSVQVSPACPLLVCVLEEYPGLLRHLDALDKRKYGTPARALVGRLLAEGRKAGVRVILVAQRMEANTVGGDARDQCALRLSWRCSSVEAVKLLHGGGLVPDDVLTGHLTAPPGVALLSAPGVPCLRVRFPMIDYARYADLTAA